MSIIMNEYKWAESAIEEKRFIDKPYETLGVIAKYYLYNGKSKKETHDLLERFVISCDKSIPVATWGKRMDSIISYAEKNPIRIIDKVCISAEEISKIQSIKSKQCQRLAFTLLCIAKLFTMSNKNMNYWVNTPDSEIMRMANINTSIKRQSLMFANLKDLGLIKFSSKIDNLSVQVLFADNGDSVFDITDFRSLGNQYMNYVNGGYYFCSNCGIICKCNKKSDKKQKYCECCAVKVRIKQNIESVMRRRENAIVGNCKVS